MVGLLDSRTLSDVAVGDNIAAAGRWWAQADVPDPLNCADLRARPDLAASAMRSRAAGGWIWGTPRGFPYLKPSGGQRALVRLDPLADLFYRERVGRVVGPVERALPASVFNARSEAHRSSWRTKDWRRAHREFREARDKASRAGYDGEARFDVRSHYATIGCRSLRQCLNSVGAGSGATDSLIESLDDLHAVPDVPQGLPVGPEGSAPLGTAALIPLDRRLRGRGLHALRWMDDVVVPLESADMFDDVMEVAHGQLHLLGQSLNIDKCEFVAYGADLDDVGSADGDGGMLSDDPLQALEMAAWLEEPRGVTMALGLLRSRSDPAGVALLKANEWMVDRFPKQVAAYLRAVMARDDSWDWVLDLIDRTTDDRNAGAQLHLARVLPHSAISPSIRASLFDRAHAIQRSRHAPLADHLFAASARARTHDPKHRRRALELAVEMAELDAARALLSTFAKGGVDRQARAGLHHIRRTRPELEMAVEWVLAG